MIAVDRADAVRRELPRDLNVLDFDDFLQVVDREGNHVALVGYRPWQVEIELSAVLMSDKDLDDFAQEAHKVLMKIHDETWKPAGFKAAKEGELRAGQLVEDEEQVLYSYDLPTTVKAKDPAHIAQILAWVREQDLDYVL